MTAPASHADPDPGPGAESVDVVVVGGGIAGLAAAHDLVGAGVAVVLLESADHVGGKVHARQLGGRPLDVGADSLVARHGAGVDLARRLGLDVVHPTTGTVQLLVDGRLRALPPASPFGVPTDLVGLAQAGVLSPAGLARAALEAVWPRAPHDPDDRSVADVVAARYGQEVVDRLVEPMLGGIYAGRPDRLSVEATTPLVAAADRRGRSLAHALQHALSRRGDAGPVFATPRGLMASLPVTLADHLGDVVRAHSAVTGVTGGPGGWEVAVDGAGGARSLRATAVVFATPAHVTARLLAGVAPGSAAELGLVEHASVAVVALHYGAAEAEDLPAASGILVPRREGRLVKAATWLARKWPHLADRGAVLRASVGRIDDQRFAELDDDELAAAVDAEVRDLTGLSTSATDAVVQRWPHALPQYEVGHLARIDRVRHNLPAGLLLAGAAYDGIGVSPCVASGRAAAAAATEHVTAP